MVLLPEEAEMTLAELRQMAARQQQQIEAQQQLLISKEQRLKFLKQQESRHHHLAELKVDPKCLQSLREKVEFQELKLRQLKALHGQVEQQRGNNSILYDELESVRALFSEKEKELSAAANKVEELNRQLDKIRCNKNQKVPQVSPLLSQLESLKRELLYRNKKADDQNNQISQQRVLIAQRQQDISELDNRIAELTQRLQRKQLMNQQLANQMHNASISRHPVTPPHSNVYLNSNVATVEPMQRETQEPEHTRDDLSAKFRVCNDGELSEFSLKKNDPKYQTLPYNTKFILKGKTGEGDSLTPSEDSSSDNSLEPASALPPLKPCKGIANFAPKPFGMNYNSNSSVSVARVIGQHIDVNRNSDAAVQKESPVLQKSSLPSEVNEKGDSVDGGVFSHNCVPDVANKPEFLPRSSSETPVEAKIQKEKTFSSKTTTAKPVVPPKPTLPVKPIPPPRQTPTKERSNNGEPGSVVSMALSVLQNKSSASDRNAFSNYRERLLYYRCVPRYSLQNTANSDRPNNESKVRTYFSKSTELKSQEPCRRKATTTQLPIKAKPLTIRKTPGIEPPKLKVPQGYGKKIQESVAKPMAPSAYSLQKEERCVSHVSSSTNVPKLNAINSQLSALSVSSKNGSYDDSEPLDSLESARGDDQAKELQDENGFKVFELADDDDSSSPCDSLECVPMEGSSEAPVTAAMNLGKESSQNPAFLCIKGNLKTDGSVRRPRRVSFDPLALLLDAALEGELELLKKTAYEVPNPSAANDEGITALHNAICAGHYDVVTFLVDFGCDVNAQDSDGWTPLHCAASCNNLPVVKFLVERGACIFATTPIDGETAAEKCEEQEEGFEGCSQYLYGLQKDMGLVNDGSVYAVYDYVGLKSDELSFKDGDSITVLRKGDDQESEWWWSKLSDEEGYVPRNLLGLHPRISAKAE